MKPAVAVFLVLLACAACTTVTVAPVTSVPSGTTMPTAAATPTATVGVTPPPATTAAVTPSAQPTVVVATPSATSNTEPGPSPTLGEEPPFVTDPPAGSDLERLWRHIPAGMRQECHETSSFDAGHVTGVQCLPDAFDGYITYGLFDSVANLQAAYQSNVDFFGEEATGATCENEPAEGGYTIGGTPAGRLMCAPYEEGLIATWTHEEFLILATMVMYAEDYPAFWSIWQVAGPDPAEGPPAPTAEASTAPLTWFDSAQQYRGRNSEQFSFVCPPDGSPTAVYGTDTYTDDSSICVAAVHAGLITFEAGGSVTIEIRPGLDSYTGSSRNGVTSSNWGSWSGSFIFVP